MSSIITRIERLARSPREEAQSSVLIIECMDGRVGLARSLGFEPFAVQVIKTPGGWIDVRSDWFGKLMTSFAFAPDLVVFSYHVADDEKNGCAAVGGNNSQAHALAKKAYDEFVSIRSDRAALMLSYSTDTGRISLVRQTPPTHASARAESMIQEISERSSVAAHVLPVRHREHMIFIGTKVAQLAPYFDGAAFGITPVGDYNAALEKAAALVEGNILRGRTNKAPAVVIDGNVEIDEGVRRRFTESWELMRITHLPHAPSVFPRMTG